MLKFGVKCLFLVHFELLSQVPCLILTNKVCRVIMLLAWHPDFFKELNDIGWRTIVRGL